MITGACLSEWFSKGKHNDSMASLACVSPHQIFFAFLKVVVTDTHTLPLVLAIGFEMFIIFQQFFFFFVKKHDSLLSSHANRVLFRKGCNRSQMLLFPSIMIFLTFSFRGTLLSPVPSPLSHHSQGSSL